MESHIHRGTDVILEKQNNKKNTKYGMERK